MASGGASYFGPGWLDLFVMSRRDEGHLGSWGSDPDRGRTDAPNRGVDQAAASDPARTASGITGPVHRGVRVALWLIVSVGVVAALSAAFQGAAHLTLPGETTGPETYILDGTRRVATGEALYPPLGELPYVVHVYNPLTYLPAGLAGRWAGLDLVGMRLVGRLVSYGSLVVLALLLFLWIRERTGDWRSGALAALGLFYFQWPILSDFFRYRPETPALLFTLVGVGLFLRGDRRATVAAAVAFFLGFCFKQPFVSAPAAAAVYLVLLRDWRRLAAFTVTMAALLAGFYLVGFLATGPNHFDNTVVAMARSSVDPVAGLRAYGLRIAGWFPFLVAATVLAAGLLAGMGRYRFLVVYLGVCGLWTLYAAGKFGASFNYYAELLALSLGMIGLAVGARRTPRVRLASTAVLGAMAAQVAFSTVERGPTGPEIPSGHPYDAGVVAMYGDLPQESIVLPEWLAVHADRVALLDLYLLHHLEQNRVIDTSELFRRIAEGRYRGVVLGDDQRHPIAVRIEEAVRSGPYEVVRAEGGFTEWRALTEARRDPPRLPPP